MTAPELPSPSGYDADGTPWWRLSSGERVYAVPGAVYTPTTGVEALDVIEGDALAQLAAVQHARGQLGGAA
jgi:hypothetical protein